MKINWLNISISVVAVVIAVLLYMQGSPAFQVWSAIIGVLVVLFQAIMVQLKSNQVASAKELNQKLAKQVSDLNNQVATLKAGK
jgi:hypothetical protein